MCCKTDIQPSVRVWKCVECLFSCTGMQCVDGTLYVVYLLNLNRYISVCEAIWIYLDLLWILIGYLEMNKTFGHIRLFLDYT